MCLFIWSSLKYSIWQKHSSLIHLHLTIMMYCFSFTDTIYSSFSSTSAVLRLSPAFEMEDRYTDSFYHFIPSISKTKGKRDQTLYMYRLNGNFLLEKNNAMKYFVTMLHHYMYLLYIILVLMFLYYLLITSVTICVPVTV